MDLGRWVDAAAAANLERAHAGARFEISPPVGAWPPAAWPDAGAAPFRPFAVPFVELRARVAAAAARGATFSLTYERGGKKRKFARRRDGSLAPGSDASLVEPLPAPWRWIFKFRPFDPAGASPCRH